METARHFSFTPHPFQHTATGTTMEDLWFAIFVMSLLSITAGVIAAYFAPAKRQPQMLLITLVTTGMFAFIFYAAGHLFWATLIEDSAVIIWSNLAPVLGAVAAGVCWRLADTPRWRRLAMALALAGVSASAVLWPFLGIALRGQPAGGNDWQGPVAMQTSWATCSPAAAATFLNAGGIRVSEAEMIPRCLTDTSGTPSLGLYRGVKVTANEASRKIEAKVTDLDELLRKESLPALLLVKLPESGVKDPRYAQQWGWIPGVGHSVVALDLSSDGIMIADPAVGREFWTREDLEVLWHGDVIQFVPEL